LQQWTGRSGDALFDTLIVFENYPVDQELRKADTGLATTTADTAEKTHYPLTITVAPGGAVEIKWSWDGQRIDAYTIGQLEEHYRNLLAAFTTADRGFIDQLAMLGRDEERSLVADWNETATSFDPVRYVHERIAAQAERTPDDVAIRHGGEHLTYRELEERANRLARHLQEHGARPDTIIGLCLERSADMIVGLLAILKTGAAYLPLDPRLPQERIAYMVEDAGAAVVVSSARHAGLLPGNIKRVDIDRTNGAHSELLPVTQHPDQLAYVIYTSGSTGMPKGVMITHAGLHNYLSYGEAAYAPGSGSGAPVNTPLSFDATVTSILLPLLAGKCLWLVGEDNEIEALAELLQGDHDFSLVKLTPAHLDALAHLIPPEKLAGQAHALVIGGEALRAGTVASWRNHAPATRLINEYGPTETVVGCIVHTVRESDSQTGDVLIGRPIANTRILALDHEGRLSPLGAVGEICIGGAGLARGYLSRPDLTAERFVPDPSGNGERLYRSGDLARRLADGSLEYLGRADDQVKIRGYRIELGEIQAALIAHPQVREAAVIALDDHHGGKRLAAYVVPATEGPGSLEEDLRAHLADRLPAYMVPGAVVFLDAMPLTVNGKLDRRALPEPETSSSRIYVTPATPMEKRLARIWHDVLRIDAVGALDNFFERGGHSLVAVRVLWRIRQDLHRDIQLRLIFETPVLRDLAAELEKLPGVDAEIAILPRPAGQNRVALSHAQERLWFLWRLEPDSPAYNIVGAVRLDGALNVGALREAVTGLVRRHESLRTRFEDVDGTAWQVIEPEPAFGWTEHDLAVIADHQAREAALREALDRAAQTPFDLEKGPVLRIELFHLGEQEHVLHFAMHHIVSDGWSIDILVREFAAFYEAALESRQPDLPELPIQYADYALWQREWLDDEALKGQLDYWKNRLGDEHPVLQLPTKSAGAQLSPEIRHGGSKELVLDPETVTALRQASAERQVALFPFLLAAFDVLLYRYCNESDIRVGVPVAGRQRVETEGLIGFFVNTLVIRSDVRGDMTFGELLDQVRDRVLEAQANQDLPFAKLVEALQPERVLGQTPLFQVMFSFVNRDRRDSFSLAGINSRRESVAGKTAQFDLTFQVIDDGESFRCVLDYNAAVLDEGTVTRVGQSYQDLLRQVSHDSNIRVAELHVDPEVAGITAPRDAVAFHGVTDRVREQADRRPLNIAVSDGDDRIDYATLEAWSNRIGRRLKRLDIAPE
ncbi:amino acid adenylation domain-containing protein, partial [Agrobacterium tumefaciens]|uniref:amino acid adenylation domain-containing protein n=1 Tax=Agrobacterium tumefaciens TaxID=358 RepID=UPI0022433A88